MIRSWVVVQVPGFSCNSSSEDPLFFWVAQSAGVDNFSRSTEQFNLAVGAPGALTAPALKLFLGTCKVTPAGMPGTRFVAID